MPGVTSAAEIVRLDGEKALGPRAPVLQNSEMDLFPCHPLLVGRKLIEGAGRDKARAEDSNNTELMHHSTSEGRCSAL